MSYDFSTSLNYQVPSIANRWENNNPPTQDSKDTVEDIAQKAVKSLTLGMYGINAATNHNPDLKDKTVSTLEQLTLRRAFVASENVLGKAIGSLRPDLVMNHNNSTAMTSGSPQPLAYEFGKMLHQQVAPHLASFHQGLQPETLKVLNDNFNQFSYRSLLWGGNETTMAPLRGFSGSQWKAAVGKNFSQFLKTPENISLTPTNYLKYSVGGNWLRGITEYLQSGKGLFGALIGGLNLFVNALNVGLTMRRAYRKSEEKHEGASTNLYKALKSGFKELARTLLCWEASSLAFLPIFNLVALPFFGTAAALTGSIFTAAVVSKEFTNIFGSAVEEDQPGKMNHSFGLPVNGNSANLA